MARMAARRSMDRSTRCTAEERHLKSGTVDTTPRHIWMHEVYVLAARHGAHPDTVRLFHDKLHLWYRSGEPMWMAADSLIIASMAKAIALRAEAEDAGLKRMLRKARFEGQRDRSRRRSRKSKRR